MLRKRLWTALLALLLVALCAPAFAEVMTGKIGEGSSEGSSTADYTFEEAHGVLTISGGSFTWQQWIYSVGQHFGNGANVTKVVFNNTTMSDASPQFYNWLKLKEVDFSGLTSGGQVWENVFSGCSALETVNFNGLKIPNATNIHDMFASCTSLKKVDLTGLDTSDVTDMSNMFVGCTALTTIDFGTSFDVSNVTDMCRMFGGCVNLTELDLSNWKTSNVTDMSYMFQGCTNLMTIYAGDGWTTNRVSSSANMFSGDIAINGAMGTMYDENHVDSEYARVDNPPTWPGYLCLHKEKPTVTPPTALNPSYTGSPLALISAGSSSSGVTMTYTLDEENVAYSATIPTATEPGEYTVWWFVDETPKYMPARGTVDVTIGKGTPTVSDPTAKSLTYNGEAQELVNGDITPAEMTMLYALGSGDYGASLPTATNAGSYTVSYRADETTHYKAYGPKTLTVEIKKADPKVTAPIALDLTYSGTFQTLVIPGSAEPGEMLYNGGVTTPPAEKNAGEYKVDYWVKQDKDHEKNYNGTQVKTITAKIEKDWPDYMPPKPLTLVYTGAAQTLAEAGWSEAGTTMFYRLKDGESWDVTLPSATNVGSYELEYYVQGNANYKDQPVRSVVAQIVSQSEAEETKKEAEEAAKKVADSALNGTDAGNALTKALNGDDVGKQAAATAITNDLDRFYTSEEQKDLNLSAYDIEKAIANKEAEASDLELEKSGEVKDATVPAATDLIANSDTASDALKDANASLSVQPKVVQPEVNVASADEIAKNLGVTVQTDVAIASPDKNLSAQTAAVEELFNKVSGDLAGAVNASGGTGVVIATVFPQITAGANSGFYPLKVNLRNLLPGRKLMFWPSVAYFRGVVSGVVSVAGVRLADGEGDCYFLDEAGNKVDLVSGDASNMTVVPYLTAGGIYSDAFITVDATSSDKSALEKLAASSDPNNPDNPDSPTSNKGSGGCDAGLGVWTLIALAGLAALKWKR